MFTKAFLQATLERAIKTFAQTLGALLVAGGTGLLNTPWKDSVSVAGMATLLSVLTSVGSGLVSSDAGPSLTNSEVLPPPPAVHGEVPSNVAVIPPVA